MNKRSIPDEVNIGDILRLGLPLKTTVFVGPGLTRRHVQWVVMLTAWEDLEAQVQADDLVLVPPVLQRQLAPPELYAQFKALSALSAAAVLLFEPVPEDVAAAVGELGLPLLVTPPGTAVREIHQGLAALLVDKRTATSERGMQLYRKLSEMSREGQGLPAMIEVMCKLTGKIVVIQDKRLDIQAISVPHNNTIDLDALTAVLARRDQLPSVLRNRKAAARARQSYWQQLLPIENIGRLVSPIVSGDRARGYLSIVGHAGKLDLLDSLTVEHGADACALEMAKAKAVSEAKKALRGNFLEGLLAGRLPQKEIRRLESRLDHDTQQPHAVLTFAWVGENTPSLRRLETTIGWLLDKHGRRALVHIYGEQHVCVFQALKDSEDLKAALEFARRLREHTEAEFPQAQLIGGISGPAEALTDWPRVYQEALQAMQLGMRLKLNQAVTFSSLGVYRLIGQLEDIPEVRRFYEQVIGPLAEYDRQHQGSLVLTIDEYFNHHGNISQAAEALFIHRNTLLYRLDRIQEITGHQLDQANMRLALHLALKLWQLRPET
ncbi:MAG: PucR family transcriptional regulator [Anaerolineae bacterium]